MASTPRNKRGTTIAGQYDVSQPLCERAAVELLGLLQELLPIVAAK
jgi:hypothetical protein